MGPSETGQLITVIILLCLSAFFSSSETALTTVNQIRMRTLADNGDKRAARVLRVTGNPGKMLSAILIGNNIVNLSASSISTSLAIHLFGNTGAGYVRREFPGSDTSVHKTVHPARRQNFHLPDLRHPADCFRQSVLPFRCEYQYMV